MLKLSGLILLANQCKKKFREFGFGRIKCVQGTCAMLRLAGWMYR